MKTLAIDTSTYVMGVAVLDGNQVLGEMTTNLKKNHSVRLMPAIELLMKDVNVKPAELERIVVAEGPGSYTGVRIGVTTAKTLAWSLGISLVGVSSLEVMAQRGRYFSGLIVPLIDARRGQVYTGLYQWDGKDIKKVDDERLIQASEWADSVSRYEQPVLLIGQDLEIHGSTFKEGLKGLGVIAVSTEMLPSPAELARLGQEKQPVENVHTFVPRYLQLAEAEANWLKAQKKGDANG
ncbi:tRNA (adenosine(37)-N6)-threonylcarbamoyltransferase complex dimerization subunit type 1 TsaB [Halalkalibacterium ligniniphilum]|uniref:tRNA (adenosine(37)-N6)-threonylcarbamoyltransferase complex dimerization subunit type 1 TsaB n=1 Tax=Halalkalibacterium ligniniphilum TaxID=1134413 RepID=UPI00034D79E9|nr:tRNA (adenosine(37)-N6)-threonylcarbamoyltransferase complex dimerization subunit type 1 TsaB [Halalkalibacterium ligniniphilum]